MFAPWISVLLFSWAGTENIGFRDVTISTELGAWDRGRARMYLESAALGCTLASKRDLDGEYPIALRIDAKGRAKTIDVRGGKPMARCLKGMLRNVLFPAAGGYSWTGVLRIGITPGLNVRVMKWDYLGAQHEHTLRNVVLSGLEELPACVREALADGTSVALHLEMHVEPGGTAATRIEESTHAPAGLTACLTARFEGVTFPASHTYADVKMFFHILQPSDAPPDDDTPVLMMKEKD